MPLSTQDASFNRQRYRDSNDITFLLSIGGTTTGSLETSGDRGWFEASLTEGAITAQSTSEDDYSNNTNTTGSINIGGTTTGSLETSGDRDWFEVSLTEGASYEFNHVGNTLSDPYLYLRDQNGNLITSNDDGGSGYNSRITFNATSTGSYFIAAGSYGDRLTGSYTLSATQTSAPPTAPPTSPPTTPPNSPPTTTPPAPPTGGDDYSNNTNTTGSINIGGTTTGSLETSGDRDWFEVSLTEGASYEFNHVGNTLSDPYLYLRDQNGNLITSNDDGGSGYNSRITFNATSTGSYFIAAGSYGDRLTGSYTLSATQTSAPPTAPPTSPPTTPPNSPPTTTPPAPPTGGDDYSNNTNTTGSINIGGTTTGSLETSGDRDWFEVSLTEGASYEFNHVGNTLSDPYLYLRDQNGNLITSNDDGGSGYNSRITFNATSTGSYFIAAGSYGDRLTGSYTLSATQTSAPPTAPPTSPPTTPPNSPPTTTPPAPPTGGDDYSNNTNTTGSINIGGTTTGSLETSGDRDWFEVSLTEGASYEFNHVGNTLSDPYLYLRDQNGNLITSNDDGGSGYNSRITFNATSTGSYFIAAGSYGDRLTGSYTLSATQTSAPPTAPIDNGDAAFSISGTPQLNQQLSIQLDANDPDGNGDFSYSWQSSSDNNTWSTVATGQFLTVTQALEGQQVQALISYTDAEGFSENIRTDSVTILNTDNGDAAFSISGTPQLNQQLSIQLDANDPDGNGDFSYSWQSSSDNNTWSTVATGQSLTVTQALEGQQVQALISYTDAEGFSENIRTDSVTILNTDNGDAAFSISGTPQLNQQLSIQLDANDPDGNGDFSYSWQSSSDNNTWSTVATGQSLTVTQALEGQQVQALISYTDAEGFSENIRTDSVTILNTDNGDAAFSISGTPQLNQQLSIQLDANDPDGNGDFSYSWQSSSDNNTWSTVATGQSLTVTQALEGQQVQALISYTDAEGFSENIRTDSVTILNTDNGDDYSASINTTGSISIGGSTTGVLETSGDRDWFEVSLTEGASYEFNHVGNSLSDPYLYLRDQNGNLIKSNDDGGSGYNSRITFNASTTGAHFIDAGSYRDSLTGSYTLSVIELPAPEAGFSSTDGWGEVSASSAFEQLLDIDLPSAGNLGGNYWGLDNINAPEVWAGSGNFSGVTGEGVTVAVIDTGVDLDHAEFQGRMTAGYDFVDNDTIADDGNGHGTHVAGTIAGDDNDGFGISGVAPDALIMPIRVLDNNGDGYTSDIIKGITWAVDNGADVVNLSLGGGGYSQAMADAIEYASNQGTVVVMAAGNSGGNSPNYPAAHAVDHGIAVGAVDQNRNIANFSNLAGNTTLDYVTAPGVSIYSSVPNGQYDTFSGTSMAAPHVAGVAALLKSYDNSLTASAIEDLITDTSSNAPSSSISNQTNQITSLQTSEISTNSNIITLDTLSQYSEDQLTTRLIGRIGSSNSQTNQEIIQQVNTASQGNTINSIEAIGSGAADFITFNLSETIDSINQTELLSDLLKSNQFEYFEVDSLMTTLHTTNTKTFEISISSTEDQLTGAKLNTSTANDTIQSPSLQANEENTENFDQESSERSPYQIEAIDANPSSLSPSLALVAVNENQPFPGLSPNAYLENPENNSFLV